MLCASSLIKNHPHFWCLYSFSPNIFLHFNVQPESRTHRQLPAYVNVECFDSTSEILVPRTLKILYKVQTIESMNLNFLCVHVFGIDGCASMTPLHTTLTAIP